MGAIGTVLALLLVGGERGPIEGFATYYDSGLMQEVAAYRGMDLGNYAGGVALNDCDLLGTPVWLVWPGRGGEVSGPYLTVDCAYPPHGAERERRGYVVEVDAEVAQAQGWWGVGPVRTEVWPWEPEALWTPRPN